VGGRDCYVSALLWNRADYWEQSCASYKFPVSTPFSMYFHCNICQPSRASSSAGKVSQSMTRFQRQMAAQNRNLLTYFLRLLSVTTHSTSSSRQFVHGAPCSTTLHLTFRALQHAQALLALRFTGLPLAFATPFAPFFLLTAGGAAVSEAGDALSYDADISADSRIGAT
jgi:hypothetical protein